MFCPNCGTQNEETASTCSKCGFNLRASAPKFKGTMLMVNSPVAPGAAAPAPAPAPPAQDQAAINKALRGTVVGIAPPAAGGHAPPPQMVPSPFGPPAAPPVPYTPPPAPPPEAAPAPAPAHVGGHAPVNPFAGTMIGTAPPPNFPGFPDPAAAPAPPAQPAPVWNTPAPAPAPANPGGETASWGGGAPVPTPAPAPTPFGQGPGAIMPAAPPPGAMIPVAPPGPANLVPPAGPAPMGGALAAPPGAIRNPTTITLITLFGCGVGALYGLHNCRQIEGELKKMLGRPDGEGNILWYFFALIPLLSMPALIAEARARVGTQTQGAPGLIGYLFGWFYLLPKDANEIFEAASRRG